MDYYTCATEGDNIDACLMCGIAFQKGLGTTIDPVISASFFQRAALSGDPRGQNSFGKCLEGGIGCDADLSLAVRYYKSAATAGDADGANNYGLSIESGICGPENPVQSAKYYRFASDHGHAAGANNYGICLERGYGVKRDLETAAKFYRLAADRGHADGTNNFGFCLEHGIGVTQDLWAARRYYSLAMQLNHPEAELNYRRLCRLLGEWSVPLRCTTEENLSDKAFERCRSTVPAPDLFLPEIRPPRSAADLRTLCIFRKVFRAVRLESWDAMKIPDMADETRTVAKPVQWDAELEGELLELAQFQHPCVLPIDGYATDPERTKLVAVSQLMGNGSLDVTSRGKKSLTVLSPTKHSKIVAGVVLALRFMHQRNIYHGNLKPTNLLLDEKWRVRISDFRTSKFNRSDGVAHYMSPERFEGCPPSAEDDVYAFGSILYEVVVGKPAFSWRFRPEAVMRLKLTGKGLEIPDRVEPRVADLIWRCSAYDSEERPSFDEIFATVKAMDFRILPNVRSKKVLEFVEQIERWEERRLAFLDGDADGSGRRGGGG
jgi:TPR repeat protein